MTAGHAVLCTNGFVDHVVEDEAGERIGLVRDQEVVGTIGYMAAFVEERPRTPAAMSYIRNETIGGDTPYVYVTRRTYDRPDGDRHADLHGRPRASGRRRLRSRGLLPGDAAHDDGRDHPAVRAAVAPAGPCRTTSSGTG